MSEPAKPYIGGQAVVEGVMMRAPTALTIAVRRPDGTIAVREAPFRSRFERLLKVPFVRGVVTFVESLQLGFDAMSFALDQQMTDEDRANDAAQGPAGLLPVVISVAAVLGLFIATPQALAHYSARALGLDLDLTSPLLHVMMGGFKLLVMLCYFAFLGTMKETRRLFEYHGAEHMTISAHEQGLPLTVENVRKQTTLHARCGTTFMVLVVLVSIVVGSTVAPLVLPRDGGIVGQLALFAMRVALLPVIAGFSFELQRFTARYCLTGPLRVLLAPGLLFQKITTRAYPSDDQIELAIAAMEAAAWRDRVGARATTESQPLVFPSFEAFAAALPSLRPELG